MYCLSEWSGITSAIECCWKFGINTTQTQLMLQTIPHVTRATHIIAPPLYRRVQLAQSVLEDGLDVSEDNFRTRATVIVRIERSSFPGPATFVWRFFRYMESLQQETLTHESAGFPRRAAIP
jgi:hypothetical protein